MLFSYVFARKLLTARATICGRHLQHYASAVGVNHHRAKIFCDEDNKDTPILTVQNVLILSCRSSAGSAEFVLPPKRSRDAMVKLAAEQRAISSIIWEPQFAFRQMESHSIASLLCHASSLSFNIVN